MKTFIIPCLSLLALLGPMVTGAKAENLFAPLNKIYDVDANSNPYGVRRQGSGKMNTNLLSKIFNPGNEKASQVPLQMLDGSQSTLLLHHQQTNNVDGIQIVSGIVDGESHNMATLVNDNGQLRGRIWKDGQLYRLEGDESGEYRLSEINIARLAEGEDMISPKSPDLKRASSKQRSAEKQTLPPRAEPIDVLLLITARAIVKMGGKKKTGSEMELLMAETNNVYRQSGITKGNMFRVVGWTSLPFEENGDLGKDLGAWKNNKSIISLRNKLGADLVAFITAPEKPKYCGIAYLGPEESSQEIFPQLGYSLSVLNCALTNLTFAHELGHNLGALHDRYVVSTTGHNHGFVNVEKNWRTVMAYSSYCREKHNKACPKIPYFSNPRLKYKNDIVGAEKGRSDAADNADTLFRYKQIVASYRSRADATGSTGGSQSAKPVASTTEQKKVGGIILEQAHPDGNKQDGKERVIKW
jgi:hypothetical protein